MRILICILPTHTDLRRSLGVVSVAGVHRLPGHLNLYLLPSISVPFLLNHDIDL